MYGKGQFLENIVRRTTVATIEIRVRILARLENRLRSESRCQKVD